MPAVPPDQIKEAEKLLEHGDERLIESVRSGETTLLDAAKIIDEIMRLPVHEDELLGRYMWTGKQIREWAENLAEQVDAGHEIAYSEHQHIGPGVRAWNFTAEATQRVPPPTALFGDERNAWCGRCGSWATLRAGENVCYSCRQEAPIWTRPKHRRVTYDVWE
jgi:hypothetical protein